MSTEPWPLAPVLVLGAGPVGQTTALLLARWGVPSIVLDRRQARDPVGSKAICQQRDVLDVWEAVGAGRRIAEEGVTWTTARTFHRGTELFSYEFAEPGTPAFPPFVNLSQTRTEAILDQRIAAEPLVDLRWGQEVTGIEQDADGVAVRLADGRSLPGSYLVVCAGARSDELRRLLGVRFDGESFDDRFLICDIRAELPGWATERRFHFDPAWNPGRQVLIHPCPGSTFRIDWQVAADYDLDAEVASGALDTRIRRIIGDHAYEIVWKSVYRFQSRVVDRMRVGRVLIAGDAAHLVSPFGARGLNSGVGDAENAAWKLAYAGYGRAPAELLETYHDERHAAARENIAVTTATMDFLVPPDHDRARRRDELLARAATDPAARAAVDSGRLAEPFWYVDSPLTTPDPRRPFAGRPPRGEAPPAAPGVLLPDAPVVVPGAGRTRMRALARDGFLVLAGPEADLPPDLAGSVPGLAAAGSAAERAAGFAAEPAADFPAEPAVEPMVGPAAEPPSGLAAGSVAEAAADLPADFAVGPAVGSAAGPVVERAAGSAAGWVRVLRLDEIDPGGGLTAALCARPDEMWLIRPDAHIAAVCTDPAELGPAFRRALGSPRYSGTPQPSGAGRKPV